MSKEQKGHAPGAPRWPAARGGRGRHAARPGQSEPGEPEPDHCARRRHRGEQQRSQERGSQSERRAPSGG